MQAVNMLISNLVMMGNMNLPAGAASSDGHGSDFGAVLSETQASEAAAAKQEPEKTAEATEATAEEEPLADEAEEEAKSVDEEDAANYYVFPPQIQNTDRPEAVDSESLDSASPDLAPHDLAPLDSQPLISVLEGNMDISVPDQETPAAEEPAEPVEETTARMPLTTEPETVEEPAEKQVSENESLCPLENENEVRETAEKQSGSFDTESSDEQPNDEPIETNAMPVQQVVDITPERINAEELLEASVPERPVTTDNLFDAMVDKIQMSTQSDVTEMQIQLKPEFLGKVSIQLSLGADGLQVRIKAEDMNVKSLIASQLSVLSETLSDKGIKINQLEVVYTDVSEQQFDQSQSQQQSRQESGNKGYGADWLDVQTLAATSWSDEVEALLDLGISSVEYRA